MKIMKTQKELREVDEIKNLFYKAMKKDFTEPYLLEKLNHCIELRILRMMRPDKFGYPQKTENSKQLDLEATVR
jgi:hypothetical protein